eukprot:UN18869
MRLRSSNPTGFDNFITNINQSVVVALFVSSDT